MKRFWRFAIPSVVVLVLVLLGLVALRGKGVSEGIYIATGNGSHIIVLDDSPVVMSNQTGRVDAFADLKTGDRLLILHDGINESYPGQTGVYLVARTGSGHADEIPSEILDSLLELGWIS